MRQLFDLLKEQQVLHKFYVGFSLAKLQSFCIQSVCLLNIFHRQISVKNVHGEIWLNLLLKTSGIHGHSGWIFQVYQVWDKVSKEERHAIER